MAFSQEGWRQQWPSGLSAFTVQSGQSSGLFTIQVTFPLVTASGTVFAIPHTLPVTPQILFATISGRTESVETIGRLRCKKGFGFAVKPGPLQSITQICYASNSDDNNHLTACSDQLFKNAIIGTMTSGQGSAAHIQGLLSVIAVDSGLVTFQVLRDFDFAYMVQLHLIGGTDITHLDLREYSKTAGVGIQTRTDPGFKPDCIIFFGGTTNQSFGPGTLQETGNGSFIGVADANLNQWVLADGTNDVDTGRAMSYMRSGECCAHWIGSYTGFETHATLVSMDTLGFSLNWIKADHDREYGALCIKGGNWEVGNFSTQTDTSEHQVVNNLSFQPASEFIFSAGKPISTYNTGDANDQWSVGMAKNSVSNYVQNIWGQNFPPGSFQSVNVAGNGISFNSAYIQTNMSGTVFSKFAVSSVQANGFSIQHSVVNSGISFVGFLACAPIVTPQPSTVVKTIKPGGGGDYPTLFSGLATEIFAHQNLVSQNIILEFDCYPGIEFHSDDIPLIIHGWNESAAGQDNIGYKTDANHYL